MRTIENGEVLDLVYLDNEVLEEHSGAWSRSHWLTGALDGALGFTMHCDPSLGECGHAPTIMQASAVDAHSKPRSFATLLGHRNDVHAVVDSKGDVVERYAYDMNGDTIWQDSEGIGHWESKDLEERCWAGSEDAGCRSHYGNVRRFTGARWDPSSATYYLRARTYSPHLALFTSRDPLGDVDSYDVWMYVGGNPFALVDPWGMCGTEDPTDAMFPVASAADIALANGRPGWARYQDLMGARGEELVRPLTDSEAWIVEQTLAEVERIRRRTEWYTDPRAAIAASIEDAVVEVDRIVDTIILIEDALDGHATAQAELSANATIFIAETALVVAVGRLAGARPRRSARDEGRGTFYVDPRGNTIPTPRGGYVTSSPDGRYIQARDASGNMTGVRIDDGHKPAGHPDPRAQRPHGHVPGLTNDDGTPWLPIH